MGGGQSKISMVQQIPMDAQRGHQKLQFNINIHLFHQLSLYVDCLCTGHIYTTDGLQLTVENADPTQHKHAAQKQIMSSLVSLCILCICRSQSKSVGLSSEHPCQGGVNERGDGEKKTHKIMAVLALWSVGKHKGEMADSMAPILSLKSKYILRSFRKCLPIMYYCFTLVTLSTSKQEFTFVVSQSA